MNRAELPSLGAAAEGGFYLGEIEVAGVPRAIIGAPKAEGEITSVWGAAVGALSWRDSESNTLDMAAADNPLAAWASGLRIGGRADWCVPAAGVLATVFPASLSLPESERFEFAQYLSSTQDDKAAVLVVAHKFDPDGHLDTVFKDVGHFVRVVRIVTIE